MDSVALEKKCVLDLVKQAFSSWKVAVYFSFRNSTDIGSFMFLKVNSWGRFSSSKRNFYPSFITNLVCSSYASFCSRLSLFWSAMLKLVSVLFMCVLVSVSKAGTRSQCCCDFGLNVFELEMKEDWEGRLFPYTGDAPA